MLFSLHRFQNILNRHLANPLALANVETLLSYGSFSLAAIRAKVPRRGPGQHLNNAFIDFGARFYEQFLHETVVYWI